MALKDSFIGLNKALRTTLQNVPAVVDTLIRGFDEIGDVAEAEGTYSTDERVVGKWIDESDVYERVVNIGALPNNTVKKISLTDANISRIITMQGYATDGTYNIPIQYATADNNGVFKGVTLDYLITNKELTIVTYSNRSSFTECYVIIRYIKASASRSPVNDTKNGGDDVPFDVKTVEDPVPEEPAEELKK